MTACMFSAWRLRRLTLAEDQVSQVRESWMRQWAYRTARGLGVDAPQPGAMPDTKDGRLIIANHRCAADIPILLSLFGGRLLSRADLGTWPVIGTLAREVETLFVDRDDQRSGATAIRQIRAALRAGGTVIVFPEGTTFQGDEVQPFHAGAFAAAKGLSVQVIPVGIAYPPAVEWWQTPFGDHIRKIAARKSTAVEISIGEPQSLAGRRTDEVSKDIRSQVQALVNDSRHRLSLNPKATHA